MNEAFNLDQAAQALEDAGYDIMNVTEISGGAIRGRRERAGETTTVVADASGRVRIEVVQERDDGERREATVAGASLSLVVLIQRLLSATGHLATQMQFTELVSMSGAELAASALPPGEHMESAIVPEDLTADTEPPPWWSREAGPADDPSL